LATAASPLRNVVQPGEQVPLLAGSASKVLMAYMPKSQLTPIVSSIARQTKRSQADVLEELTKVRRQGYAFSHGERLLGVSAVSAPIMDTRDEVHYCLSIGGPTVRMQTSEKELIKRAKKAAADISRQFGGKQD
jgi:DNA-binding IclR family transcriptional regulator